MDKPVRAINLGEADAPTGQGATPETAAEKTIYVNGKPFRAKYVSVVK